MEIKYCQETPSNILNQNLKLIIIILCKYCLLYQFSRNTKICLNVITINGHNKLIKNIIIINYIVNKILFIILYYCINTQTLTLIL